MRKARVRVRKKGQLTLPLEVRRAWGVDEGSELMVIYDERGATVKPVKKIRVRDFSGALGDAGEDELTFSILDPEMVPLYFKEKYKG